MFTTVHNVLLISLIIIIRYQWFCHVDDDVYINIPELSHLLQQYDPHQPYYIGRWMRTKFPALNVIG